MTNVKGTALVSTVRYITEKFGPEGLQSLLPGLTPDEQRLVTDGFLASVWYPFPLLVKLMRLTHERFGAQVPNIYKAFGRASADYALTGIYRIFLKIGSPQFVISKSSSVMKTYFSNGEARTVVSEKGHAAIDFIVGDPAPEYCERLEGWMGRTLELSGAKDYRIVHEKCVNRGDKECRFEGWWT